MTNRDLATAYILVILAASALYFLSTFVSRIAVYGDNLYKATFEDCMARLNDYRDCYEGVYRGKSFKSND